MRTRIKSFIRRTLDKIRPYITPKFLLTFGIAWIITNGWSYAAILIGAALGIQWLWIVGTAYVAFLWLPFTPEKIVTAAIAMLLHRLIFRSEFQKKEANDDNHRD